MYVQAKKRMENAKRFVLGDKTGFFPVSVILKWLFFCKIRRFEDKGLPSYWYTQDPENMCRQGLNLSLSTCASY